MKFKTRALSILSCLVPLSLGAAEPLTVIHAGQLLAIPGQPALNRQSIIVSAAQIERVIPGFVDPADLDRPEAEVFVLDLSDRFVMPGLIDLHVHITMEPRPEEHLRAVTESDADLALTGAQHARQTLEAGFTTIVDLGRPGTPGHEVAAFALRDAIAAGKVPGPRILVTGSPLSATSQSRRPLFRDDVDQVAGAVAVCDGADKCRQAVRDQVRKGADLISFYSSGSLLFPKPVGQAMTDEEMRAIVETAHGLGRKVIADGHHAPGIVAAVGNTPETVHDGIVWWHPTPVLERLFEIKMRPFAVARGYRAGIRKIALATDAGNFPHGDNARDLVEYVKHGLPEMFALQAATMNAADLLGMTDTIGSIEPGKSADIIATAENPLADITAMTRVNFVMRDGVVYRNRPNKAEMPAVGTAIK